MANQRGNVRLDQGVEVEMGGGVERKRKDKRRDGDGDGDGDGDDNDKKVDLRDLFMMAEPRELWMLALGVVAALVNGLGDPILIVLFSSSLSALADPKEALKEMSEVALIFLYVGGGLMLAAFVQYVCFTRVASTLAVRMRKAWFKSLLAQNIEWFDCNNPSGLSAKISSSIVTYEEGLGGKLGMGVQFFAGFIGALVIGFVYNAYVSLLTLAALPLVAASLSYLVKLNEEAANASEQAYSEANGIAHESFAGLKTILALNASKTIKKKYEDATSKAKKAGIGRSAKLGFANGSMLSTFNIMYMAITLFGGWALSSQIRETGCDPSGIVTPRFRCDNKFPLNREMDGNGIFIALMCIAQAGQFLGSVSRSLDTFTQARRAIKPCVDVIRRIPSFSIQEEKGSKPKKLEGHISLSNVGFWYPTRPDAQVLSGFNLEIQAGETIALVGESGCGKSTITQLLQRFYDPMQGTVKLDGVALTDLNVRWLREQVAVVAQEPKLFSGTIAENIAYGALSAGREATQDDIVEAAKMANAHDFIMSMEQGYETDVGFGGSQLSGGQKQRIAIARALVKKAKILLLDEATSALDNKSEQVVQEALDKVLDCGSNRTTIVIAHRLSTIRTADVIGYVKDGQIVEKGTHRELMSIQGGLYRALVERQEMQKDNAGAGCYRVSSMNSERTAISEGASKADSSLGDSGAGEGKEMKDPGKKEETGVPWKRILKLSEPDFLYLVVGVLSGSVAGALYPLWGLLFGKMIVIFFTPVVACRDNSTDITSALTPQVLGFATCQEYFDNEADKLWQESVKMSIYWIALSVGCLASNILMFWAFGTAAESLSFRVRNRMFTCYLRQEPGYFDLPENAVGSVSSRLANEATLLKAKTGEPLQQIVMTIFGLVLGIVIAAVFSWPIALMAIGVIPGLGFAMYLQTSLVFGSGEASISESPLIGSLTGETLTGMRTVQGLSLEEKLISRHDILVGEGTSWKGLVKKALAFGISFAVQHWVFALLLWFGAWVLTNMSVEFTFSDFSISLFSFFFGLFGLSLAASGATDTKAAMLAIGNIVAILDRRSEIDPKSIEGAKPSQVSGRLELKRVHFCYPSRKEQKVLLGLSCEILDGQKVGLVGPSGSGKSTIIQLLERFYDPDSGFVSFDKQELGHLNYEWMHSQIGMVGQEPVLFSGTVAENISLGCGQEVADRESIVEAARLANADSFISDLPSGYDTQIGPGGTLLSGGQKQRVAIARAIICKPKVLLLDEATSALDSKSEKIVQQCLDNLIENSQLTTVMIAHRLSTVRNMDVIVVVDGGKVVEVGSHEQLMKTKGLYFSLVQASGHTVVE